MPISKVKSKGNGHTTIVTESIASTKEMFISLGEEDQETVAFSPLRNQLIELLLKSVQELYDFVVGAINLNEIDEFETEVITTTSDTKLKSINGRSLQLFVNIHPLNDFRWLNKYFLQVHKKLRQGGYFVGKADTIEVHRMRFRAKYRKFTRALYYLHFIYARVMPKIPFFKKIYFLISNGKNRALSKAEILGRLYYCGFKVIAIKETHNDFFFIARKERGPSKDKNPSYAPLIKLKRVGLNGKRIYIYKFRTMYPYSEYIQEYVFNNHKLHPNGKLNGDFRITDWGKQFRKLFIDELPQFINYLKQDINLVGVRAISEHYLELYPKDLRQIRQNYKPGLIPPYYVDLPKSFDEIIESERIYLKKKEERPLVTDL